MSLAQLVPLTGVVIVTTPHSVAANIAGKAAGLFRRLNTPLLGVVENMAGYVCPACNSEQRPFKGQTGEALANELKVPYLGSIPLEDLLSDSAEQGAPVTVLSPNSISSKRFTEIAMRLASQLSIRAMGSEA